MKKKLTKNVSMSLGAATTEVQRCAFYALLSRSCVYVDYFHMWAEDNALTYGARIEEAWNQWTSFVEPDRWLSGAFNFYTGHIPASTWWHINSLWLEYLGGNLNN